MVWCCSCSEGARSHLGWGRNEERSHLQGEVQGWRGGEVTVQGVERGKVIGCMVEKRGGVACK